MKNYYVSMQGNHFILEINENFFIEILIEDFYINIQITTLPPFKKENYRLVTEEKFKNNIIKAYENELDDNLINQILENTELIFSFFNNKQNG